MKNRTLIFSLKVVVEVVTKTNDLLPAKKQKHGK